MHATQAWWPRSYSGKMPAPGIRMGRPGPGPPGSQRRPPLRFGKPATWLHKRHAVIREPSAIYQNRRSQPKPPPALKRSSWIITRACQTPRKDAAGPIMCELLNVDGDCACCRGRAGSAGYGHDVGSRRGGRGAITRRASAARQHSASESREESQRGEHPPPTAPLPREAKK